MQQALTITSPIAASIKSVYSLPPPRGQGLPSTPCWVNAWEMTATDWTMDASPPQQTYVIPAQLFVLDADLNRAANIATAFHVALVASLAKDTTMGQTVSSLDIKGKLALLEWAGQFYAGLDLQITVEMY